MSMEWLQEWYSKQCDGTWEHTYGTKIETLDNPGWKVEIDLNDTKYQSLVKSLKINLGETDWIVCSVDNKKFKGVGDATKLNEILHVFKKWIQEGDKCF